MEYHIVWNQLGCIKCRFMFKCYLERRRGGGGGVIEVKHSEILFLWFLNLDNMLKIDKMFLTEFAKFE